jgi:hypothetical protein
MDRAPGEQVDASMLQSARRAAGEDEAAPARIAVILELDVLEECGHLLDLVDGDAVEVPEGIELPDRNTRIRFVTAAEPAVLQIEVQRFVRRGA